VHHCGLIGPIRRRVVLIWFSLLNLRSPGVIAAKHLCLWPSPCHQTPLRALRIGVTLRRRCALAERMNEQISRAMMLEIAKEYDRAAEELEQKGERETKIKVTGCR
jgi:hypothetical protein